MHKPVNIIAIFLSSLILSGCSNAADKTLSPPSNAKWVNVEVKNPSRYTKPFPLEVRYISHQCLKKRISGVDGSMITEPGYNVISMPLQQSDNNDIWKAKVAMSGGGSCEWTLSALNLGIEYIDATHLVKDLIPGTAVGVTIAFDGEASRNGQFSSVYGDVILSPKYYPYITEWNINKKQKDLSLLGEKSFLSLRAYNVSEIKFKPVMNESKVVRFVEPEIKIDGVYSKIIYPDGSIAPKGTLSPDFDKIDKMIIK